MPKRSENKWMTDEILNLMRERQTISERDSNEYKAANKIIKKICEEAQEERLNANCRDIENLKNKNSKSKHKRIKELTNHATNTTCSSGGCIKSKDGTVFMEKEKIENYRKMDRIYTRTI